MIKVKQTQLPPSGNHWSYGPNYMRGISRQSAAALCGMYPLPRMGYETTVAVKRDPLGFNLRLQVQNVSGDFYLASTHVQVAAWPDTFGVEVLAPVGGH